MNINHSIIVGRVTSDPQLRITTGGQYVLSLGIATNRTWTDKQNQKQEEVEFHNVVIFGRQAEIAAQYAKKGALLGIEGRLRTRVWADKGGTEHKTTEIICEQLHLGPKQNSTTAAPERTSAPEEDRLIPLDGEEEIKAEDIPF